MKIVLRNETGADHEAVHALLCDSFPSAAEAALVHRLRNAGALTLSMVAEVDSRVVGYIGFSPVTVEGEVNGKPATHEALGLAPLAVTPAHREQGLGAALTRTALKHLKADGHTRLCVLGDPRFYARFGFEPAEKYGVRYEVDTPPGMFRVLALKPWAWSNAAGTVHYHEEFSRLGQSE